MNRDLIDISNAAQDVANIAREAYAVAMVLGQSGDLRLTNMLEAKRESIFEEFLQLADALGCDVTKREAPALLAAEKVSEWTDIKSAPRDGTWVWLFNKHNEEPIRLFWSTNYSVFGLGGCWSDGFCTMGDGIDFDFWCEVLPADYVNPHHTAPAVEAAE